MPLGGRGSKVPNHKHLQVSNMVTNTRRVTSEVTKPLWLRISPSTNSVKEFKFGRIIPQVKHFHTILLYKKAVKHLFVSAWQLEGTLSRKVWCKRQITGDAKKKTQRREKDVLHGEIILQVQQITCYKWQWKRKKNVIATKIKPTRTYIFNRNCTKREEANCYRNDV